MVTLFSDPTLQLPIRGTKLKSSAVLLIVAEELLKKDGDS